MYGNKQVATELDQKKFFFIAISNLILSTVCWSGKTYFVPNSLIFRKSGGEQEEDGEN